MHKLKEQLSTVIILSILLVALALFFVFRQLGTFSDPATSPTNTYAPAIPESSESAKAYIDRASKLADQGEYQDAVEVLQDGLKQYPDDQNLKLTKEYYEGEAARHGQ